MCRLYDLTETLNCVCVCVCLTEKANSAPAKSVTYSGLRQHDRWVTSHGLFPTFRGDTGYSLIRRPAVIQRRRSDQGKVLRAGGREETGAGEVADTASQHRRPGTQIYLWKAGVGSWEQVWDGGLCSCYVIGVETNALSSLSASPAVAPNQWTPSPNWSALRASECRAPAASNRFFWSGAAPRPLATR